MNVQEKVKQSQDLEAAIIRLCEEADDLEVVFTALTSTIVTYAINSNIKPISLVKMFSEYVIASSNPKCHKDIQILIEDIKPEK